MTTDNELVAEGVAAIKHVTLTAEMTPERVSLITGMVIDMTLAIAPVIVAHFEHLVPDSPEDAAMLEEMQANVEIWAEAVDLLRVGPLADGGTL